MILSHSRESSVREQSEPKTPRGLPGARNHSHAPIRPFLRPSELKLSQAPLVSAFAAGLAFEAKTPGNEKTAKRKSKIDLLPGDSTSTNIGFLQRIANYRAVRSPLKMQFSQAVANDLANSPKYPGLESSAETLIRAAIDTSNLEHSHRAESLAEEQDLAAAANAFEQFLLRESKSLGSKHVLDCSIEPMGLSKRRFRDGLRASNLRTEESRSDLSTVQKIRNGFLKQFITDNFSAKNFPRLKTFENFIYASPDRHAIQLSNNLRWFREGQPAPTMTVSDMLPENERIVLSRMTRFYRDRIKLAAYAVHSDKTVNLKLDKMTRLSQVPLSEKIRIRMRFDEVNAVRKVLVLKQSKNPERTAPLKKVSFSGRHEQHSQDLHEQPSGKRVASKNISRLSSKEKFSSTPNLLKNLSEVSEQSKCSRTSKLHRKKHLASLTTTLPGFDTLYRDTSTSGPATRHNFVNQSASKLQQIIAQANTLFRVTKRDGNRLVSVTTRFLSGERNLTGPTAAEQTNKAKNTKLIKEHLCRKYNKTSDFC